MPGERASGTEGLNVGKRVSQGISGREGKNSNAITGNDYGCNVYNICSAYI
jgi:hypothetical protein